MELPIHLNEWLKDLKKRYQVTTMADGLDRFAKEHDPDGLDRALKIAQLKIPEIYGETKNRTAS